MDVEREILPRRDHRQLVLEVARELAFRNRKGLLADGCLWRSEAFVTGTFAGIVPVREIDGRKLECRGPMVERLQQLYAERVELDITEQPRP